MLEEDNALEDVNNDAHLEEGEADSQSENIQETDFDAEAKALGWSPKENWRGAEKQWVDAETFVNRGKEILPVVNERNKRLVERVNAQEQKLKEQADAFERFEKLNNKIAEQQRSEALSRIKSQQKEALENENDELYDQLEDKKVKVNEDLKVEEPKKPKPQEPSYVEPPETTAFRQQNSWYGTDPLLTDYANRYSNQMAQQGMSIPEQLEATKKYIVETFPQKFENPRRKGNAPVGKGAAPSGSKPKGMQWKNLSTSEQRLARGQMKNFGWTQEQFLKEYSEMENL